MRKILILTVLMAFVALPAQAAQTRTDDAQTVSCDQGVPKAEPKAEEPKAEPKADEPKAEGDKPCGCEGDCKGDCKAKAEGDKPVPIYDAPCGCEGDRKGDCKKDAAKPEGDTP